MPDKWIVEVAPARPAQGDRPAAGPVYRNFACKDGFFAPEGCTTLYEMFKNSAVKYADNKCLGRRQGPDNAFAFDTFGTISKKVDAIASAIRGQGINAKDKVGVYGQNCPEWMISMQACNAQTFSCVPLYDSLGADAIEYIANHAECGIVLCSGVNMKPFAQAMPQCTTVKTVVYWGSCDAADVETCKSKAEVYTFDEFIAKGEAKPFDPVPPAPEDLCTIMYTSGTTGDPKGVMIKHEAVCMMIGSMIKFLEQVNFSVTHTDVFLSYLPLAHIFDRVVEELFLYKGGTIGYWQGDVKKLVDDIGTLKPTLFIGVPRIFDRIYAGVMAAMNASFIKKTLFGYAYNSKLKALDKGANSQSAGGMWDKILFSKVKARLGGHVRLIVSGAAPLAPHVENFLRVSMCCPVVQGYGLTESCAASFTGVPEDTRFACTVGPPTPSCNVRLEAVPEMNYDPMANPPRGEVCLSGPTMFSGYYKQQGLTDEAVDEDGFFHTGDVGEFAPSGGLKIIDRKKNIFKLAQGEYVAVEKLEGVYGQVNLLDMNWVYGNSFESVLIAVVCPNELNLMKWAAEAGVKGSFAEVCADPKTNKYLLDKMVEVGKSNKLKGFEIIKAIHVDATPFDMENDLLTPTFKKKRPQLLKYYQAKIDAMYKGLAKPAPAL